LQIAQKTNPSDKNRKYGSTLPLRLGLRHWQMENSNLVLKDRSKKL
jgi:hypothetical protein